MMRLQVIRVVLLAIVLAACASPPDTAPVVETTRTWQVGVSECASHYLAGEPPLVRSVRDFGRLREICFIGYAAFHSSATRGPLWSAEHLTREMAQGGDCIARVEQGFLVAFRSPRSDRASDDDYENNPMGFQRGHMTPANDMIDEATQRQTFNLANAVPQAGELNQGRWGDLEMSLHVLAEQHGDLYIVTGPLFEREIAPPLNGRVAVPSHVFKAVYDPRDNTAMVFVAANDNDATIEQVPLATFEREHGIVPFPGLAASIRERGQAWTLPPSTPPPCVNRSMRN